MESSVSLRVKINIINFRLTCRTPVLNFLESALHKFTNTVRIRVSLPAEEVDDFEFVREPFVLSDVDVTNRERRFSNI